MKLIFGLGNPGESYAKTRHNAGFMVADAIASAFSISLNKKKFTTAFGRGKIEQNDVIIAKPMEFMNRSGIPARSLADYFKIRCRDMLVIHDDIDLAFGRIKIKVKGGHGGHNGLRSIIEAFGNKDFVRIRIGVGRNIVSSGKETDVINHVLGRFSVREKTILGSVVTRARDAAVTVLCMGVKDGMNRFNVKSECLNNY